MIMKYEYSGYLNNEHLNSRLIEVWYSDAGSYYLPGKKIVDKLSAIQSTIRKTD